MDSQIIQLFKTHSGSPPIEAILDILSTLSTPSSLCCTTITRELIAYLQTINQTTPIISIGSGSGLLEYLLNCPGIESSPSLNLFLKPDQLIVPPFRTQKFCIPRELPNNIKTLLFSYVRYPGLVDRYIEVFGDVMEKVILIGPVNEVERLTAHKDTTAVEGGEYRYLLEQWGSVVDERKGDNGGIGLKAWEMVQVWERM